MSGTPAPPRPTPKQRRERKDVRLTIVTLAIVLAVCAAAGIGAWAMSTSWWTESDPVASADQRTAAGESRFDRAGMDYLARTGSAVVHLRSDMSPATALGLEPTGETTVEPIVPVRLEITGETDTIAFAVLPRFTVVSVDDRVTAVRFEPAASGSFPQILAELRTRVPSWGWTEDEVAAVEDEIIAAGQDQTGAIPDVALPTAQVDGMTIDAVVTITGSGRPALTYTFSR